ncbi:putative glycosidase CRH1 [Pichia kudriavzevii]|uniref:Crh-like protein n=1 Tax=Pichia kudriavzevii TaxID=4909 RepID=A0A1V2LRP8_PICKU|nr:putative glycosidase CRH1 [Pichia kudriavzevii]
MRSVFGTGKKSWPRVALMALALQASQASAADSVNTVSATSVASCDPLSATSCAPDPALATSISDDFKQASEHYIPYRTPSEIFYGDDGLTLTLSKRYDNPSLVSDFYIMFGKVQVLLKSASGQGIVSSFYLQSDDKDEIDFEWLGGDGTQMQSNFFSKGDTTTYDRGEYHNMADPRADFHNYTLEWNENSCSWYIDGTVVRTLSSDSSQGYPQTPMRLFFGIWAGGDPSNQPGTIEWAGGETDYSDAPFSMHIKNLVVSDYSTGSSYSYSGTSGSWESIDCKDGSVNGREEIANAEFAALVGGNTISTESTKGGSSSTSTTSASTTSTASSELTSSSPTPTSSTSSSSSTSSTSSSSISTFSTSASSSELTSADVTSTSKTEASITANSLPTSTTDQDSEENSIGEASTTSESSETVSLKDEYLKSSTITTSTQSSTETHKQSISVSTENNDSHSVSDEFSNGANAATSSFLGLSLFFLALL